MSLKTDYSFNEDDFVQAEADMKELTVTITLCEYRNLIRENVQAAKEIELLQEGFSWQFGMQIVTALQSRIQDL